MNDTKRWLYIAALALIAAVLAWKFSTDIRLWLADVFVDLLFLIIAFCGGWLLGRFGGRKSRSGAAESVRTEAQKR